MAAETLKKYIREIPDFPRPGVLFRDLTPLLRDAGALKLAIDELQGWAKQHRPTVIAGIEARGFLFGAPVAERLGVGFVPIRKFGKLPGETIEESYSLEYGESRLAMHSDALSRGDRVVLIDDLLATGGTAAASLRLLRRVGAEVAGALFLVELTGLCGRDLLRDCTVHSLVRY